MKTLHVAILGTGIGLWAVGANAAVMTFQEGLNGYKGTEDATLNNYLGQRDWNAGDIVLKNNHHVFLVGTFRKDSTRTSLIRFDVSALAGKYQSIDSMTLTLNVEQIPVSGLDMSVKLLREGNVWGEGNKNQTNADPGEATWNNAQHPSTSWLGATGAQGSGDVYGVVATSGTPSGTLALDITAPGNGIDSLTDMVDLWNGVANNGFVLDYKNDVGVTYFYSSEDSAIDLRPQLTIEYTPPTSVPEPSAYGFVLLGMAGAYGFFRRRRNG